MREPAAYILRQWNEKYDVPDIDDASLYCELIVPRKIYGSHLAWQFGTFAVPCFRAYRDHIIADVLSGYTNIEERADRVADEAYERLGSRPCGEDFDGDRSDDAEVAAERGELYYAMMSGMRQATINLHAAGLFHLLEQQVGNLISRILNDDERFPESNIYAYAAWYSENLALDLKRLPHWTEIDELRLVANAVKHAEGKSEAELRLLRPDLFEHPIGAEMGIPGPSTSHEAFRLPLAGDGLYVTEAVFAEYATVVYDFVIAILAHLRNNAKTLYPCS